MEATHSDNPLKQVAEILTRHGGTCSPEEFHAAVNVTFHEFESEVYDQEHTDMWDSLPREFDLLAADCLKTSPGLPSGLRLLDIGCGTGLATDCLLASALGPLIGTIDLLDSSPSMLKQALKRSQKWGRPVTSFNGLLDVIPAERTYDLIVTCSVLHHVPDLAAFLRQVRAHHNHGGFFLHLQDPNGDYLHDAKLKERTAQASTRPLLPESISRFSPKRILGRLRREISGQQNQDYVSKANAALLKTGIIRTPLSVSEMYAITDIHVDDEGISTRQMRNWLPDYSLVATRSYGFFGQLRSTLKPELQTVEDELSRQNEPNGFHMAAVWHLR